MLTETISFDSAPRSGLVSIVMPTRNGVRFIGQSLESIARQTYKKWEVFIVEDGSDDGTCQIVREFACKHRWHRVDYTRNERSCGPSHSRNVAFRKARGEYIALLDVDDRWLPEHLKTTTAALEASGKDIAYSSSIMIEDQTELLLGVWGPNAGELADFPQSLFGRNFITPSATVLRRDVLGNVGLWDTYLHYCEDLAFWLRCVSAEKTFQYVSGCHCLYRKNHQGAATQRMCHTLEAVAEVTEQYMNMPALRHETCRQYTAKAFYMAAEFHLKQDPRHDPSADPTRAAALMLHAWRLHRRHVDWLWQACKQSVANLFRRSKQPTTNASIIAAPTQPQLQAAA